MPETYPDQTTDRAATDVPKSAQDAQSQAFIDEANDEARAAELKAKEATARAEKYERDIARAEAKAPVEDTRARDVFGNVVGRPEDVVSSTGPRNVPMETTEDDRLIRHKAMVRDHLRNADPDMTGGTGVGVDGTPIVDGSTGLPEGHVPEGHQDAAFPEVGRRR